MIVKCYGLLFHRLIRDLIMMMMMMIMMEKRMYSEQMAAGTRFEVHIPDLRSLRISVPQEAGAFKAPVVTLCTAS
jgi:hypothetical protein